MPHDQQGRGYSASTGSTSTLSEDVEARIGLTPHAPS
jgi:hypothetical protein